MVEWITNTINTLGYVGIGFLMFLENLFPPIPSELIMPLAGFTAAQGEMNFFYAVLAGVIGTLLGALPWYYAEGFWESIASKSGLTATANGWGSAVRKWTRQRSGFSNTAAKLCCCVASCLESAR